MKSVAAFIVAIATAGVLVSATVSAELEDLVVPEECDFITGGGFIITTDMSKANFGAHGGCKNGYFWGPVNYVDHSFLWGNRPFNLRSTQFTAYFFESTNGRIICGIGRTNLDDSPVFFRVTMRDFGEP